MDGNEKIGDSTETTVNEKTPINAEILTNTKQDNEVPPAAQQGNDTNSTASYLKQWSFYFDKETRPINGGQLGLLARLRSITFKESLRSCHFRSICWRIFLGCLSEDHNDWENATKRSRESYTRIKASLITIPQESSKQNDIQVENPLSQSVSSSWSQHFRNVELRTLIERDVRRTCPELDFYHSEKVHEMMANILFCYARQHERLSYRQGMHELLAPLIFVLHCDLQGAAHARDMGELPLIVTNLLSEEFLEHDAYLMFSKLMDATNAWYSVTEERPTNSESVNNKTSEEPIPTVPFKETDNLQNSVNSPPLEITNKLNHIHENLLATHDRELYHHLTRLEIIPQVYGLRWVRLLFGRELDLQDLLVLWDAMFADSPTLDLVDYIFVAMMINIRKQLLLADYCSCMQLLMKYPPIEDIYDLVNLAIYFRDPKSKRRPSHTKFRQPQSSVVTDIPLKKSRSNTFLPTFKVDNPFASLSRDIKKALQSPPNKPKKPKNVPATVSDDAVFSRNRYSSKSMGKSDPARPKLNPMQAMQNQQQLDLEKEVLLLRQENGELQEKCRFCSDKLDANIRLLQQGVIGRRSRSGSAVAPPDAARSDGAENPNPQEEDRDATEDAETCVAVANLKQIRDILRGSLHMEASFPSQTSIQSQLDLLPNPPDSEPLVVNGTDNG